MKKTLLAILIGISLQSLALAPPGVSSFEILSWKGNFIVGIDGHFFESRGKYVVINNLAPGHHRLEIFVTHKCNHFNHPGYCRGAKIFASSVYIPPASRLRGYIDRQGRFSMKQKQIANNFHDNIPLYQGPAAIAPAAFNGLLQTIEAQWFDDTKLAVAQQALMTNYLTSGQVAAILDVFWFEESRLAFAKAAYPRVVDPQNYYLVNNAFWFQSSVEELTAFIMAFH